MTEETKPVPVVIPGDDLTIGDVELLQNVGKYLALYEGEQRKRLVLARAYLELKAELDKAKSKQK